MTTETKAWSVTDEDLSRWKGQKAAILSSLKEGRPVSHSFLGFVTGNAKQIASRISELRKAGWLIECTRDGNQTFYQITGYTGEDNTRLSHECPNCHHRF